MSGPPPKIELAGVSLRYFSRQQETLALQDVSFQVQAGEFVSLVGPSGCGKSTLLALIAGLARQTSGAVRIDGQEVRGTSRRVGYMLQQDYLLEWRTVLENTVLGLEIQGQRNSATEARARQLLRDYGLGDFIEHMPRQLSGGMRQRIALARTMVTDPDVVLLDEPFSALDAQTRLSLTDEMGAILRASSKTVVLVTHDIAEAIAMCDRAIVLSRRPGRVKSVHRIDLPRGGAQALGPLALRSNTHFNALFQTLWDELDAHAKG